MKTPWQPVPVSYMYLYKNKNKTCDKNHFSANLTAISSMYHQRIQISLFSSLELKNYFFKVGLYIILWTLHSISACISSASNLSDLLRPPTQLTPPIEAWTFVLFLVSPPISSFVFKGVLLLIKLSSILKF